MNVLNRVFDAALGTWSHWTRPRLRLFVTDACNVVRTSTLLWAEKGLAKLLSSPGWLWPLAAWPSATEGHSPFQALFSVEPFSVRHTETGWHFSGHLSFWFIGQGRRIWQVSWVSHLGEKHCRALKLACLTSTFPIRIFKTCLQAILKGIADAMWLVTYILLDQFYNVAGGIGKHSP